MNGPNFLEINQRFEKRALDFVQQKHLEADCLTYIMEAHPDMAADIFHALSHGLSGKNDLLPLMARLLVLDPFDNPRVFGDFAESIGWSYDDLFALIVDGIEPTRTA